MVLLEEAWGAFYFYSLMDLCIFEKTALLRGGFFCIPY